MNKKHITSDGIPLNVNTSAIYYYKHMHRDLKYYNMAGQWFIQQITWD
jgi:hypothetical protein